MAHCILRVKKLKSWGGIAASCAHTFREAPTPNADPKRTPQNQAVGAKSSSAVMAALRSLLPSKRRKDAVLSLEYLVTASPEFFDGGQRRTAYFSDALKWLKALHGPENVVSASIHLDEQTPHLVAYVVPITVDGRLCAKDFVGGPKRLTKMQTDFHEQVGDKFGLLRGVQGSKARHQEVRKFYAGLSAAPALPKVSGLDHLGAALGFKTVAMKNRQRAEAVLRQRGSVAGTETLTELRSRQSRVVSEAEEQRVRFAKQAAANARVADGLRRESEALTAEVISLRLELQTQQYLREADARRFASLQALVPQEDFVQRSLTPGDRPPVPAPKLRFEK